jgi:type II restriction enzyme
LNNNVKAKIRQQLQFLRDKSAIEFIGRGRYRMKTS